VVGEQCRPVEVMICKTTTAKGGWAESKDEPKREKERLLWRAGGSGQSIVRNRKNDIEN
jgi:hypothetical protein